MTEFSRVSGKGSQTLTHPYITKRDGTLKIVLDRATSQDAVAYFGNTVRVFIDAKGGRVALTRGNDRRLVSTGSSNAATKLVALGSASDFEREWGKFSRMHMKPTWESTTDHQKALLLSPTGEIELEGDFGGGR